MKQILIRLLRPYLANIHIKTLKRGEWYELTVYAEISQVLDVLNGSNLFEVVDPTLGTVTNVIRVKTA